MCKEVGDFYYKAHKYRRIYQTFNKQKKTHKIIKLGFSSSSGYSFHWN